MTNSIICLDGYALNPGDISWAPFESLGSLTVHARTREQDVVERCAGARYVLTNKTPLARTTLEALTDLAYVGVLATGFNIVDIEAACEQGVVVTNVPTYGTDSVAQHVAALMLRWARPIGVHAQAVGQGEWARSPDWCFSLSPIDSLAGLTLGIVGVGRIGRAVARIAAAMDMRVVGHDVYWPAENQLDTLQIDRVDLDTLFRESDVISLHCPLTDENTHLVNDRRLALAKPTALLINTSRGPLVDEIALADALRNGGIGAAALDVLEVEPPALNHPLAGLDNCVITPHIAWYARSARQRLMGLAAENLRRFMDGTACNQVN